MSQFEELHTVGAHHELGQTMSRVSTKPATDIDFNPTAADLHDVEAELNLPTEILSNDANMHEYTDTASRGWIPKTVVGADGQESTYKLVTFTPGDKADPKNWSKTRKWAITMTVGWVTFAVAFGSAVVTPAIPGVAETFHVSEEVSLLTITLFVVGFGVGPLVASPLSELYGRYWIYAISIGFAFIFIIPCAVAQNTGTLLVCRLIDGIAFSTPVALVGGTMSDIWRREERGFPMAVFSGAPFLGPVLGPVVGGYIFQTIGWRWIYWVWLILTGLLYTLMLIVVPETYAPAILMKRSKKLRKEKGDASFVTEQEIDRRPLGETLQIFLLRPFKLLTRELIVIFISIYASLLYMLLYIFFVAYPIVFTEGKGMSPGSTGLMFIPIAVGIFCGLVASPRVNARYLQQAAKYAPHPPPAEIRLIPMMYSCWTIPLGMFIFAWTSYPRLTWVGPCLAGFPIGMGFVLLYNALNNYVVDSYQHIAASALAAKTFLRSMAGAGAVLYTEQMYHRLSYQWASTLIGFLALACCGIPYFFYFFGARIRKQAKYAYYEPDATPMAGEKNAMGADSSSSEDMTNEQSQ